MSPDSSMTRPFIPAPVGSGLTAVGRVVQLDLDLPELAGDEPLILVSQRMAPEQILALDRQRIVGLVLAEGGVLGHGLLSARSSQLPALLGLGDDLARLRHGELIIVDGKEQGVWLDPDPEQLSKARQYEAQQLQSYADNQQAAILPAETLDGRNLEILANLDLVDGAAEALAHGAQGVGLFRSEYYYGFGEQEPDEELLTALYEHLLTTFAPLPVTIRTLDFFEQGQAMALRGGRRTLRAEERSCQQLRALLRASQSGQLRLLFPLLSNRAELEDLRQLLSQTAAGLKDGAQLLDNIELGLLLEVPAAVASLADMAELLDFVTIGSNDLISFCCGLERDNSCLTHLYNPLHPAVLQLISDAVATGHDQGLAVELCGEMAQDPRCLPFLVGAGLDGLSVPAAAIGQLKKMVRQLSFRQARQLSRELLHCPLAEQQALLADFWDSCPAGEHHGH